MGFTSSAPSPLLTQKSASFVDLGWLTQRVRACLRSDAAEVDVEALHLWLSRAGWRGYSYLRTYVYDGQYEVDHANYRAQRQVLDAIAEIPGVDLRLGHVIERNGIKQQKGVDALIVLDMLTLAYQGAYQAAVLVAGDRDFAQVVRAVQGRGIFVAQSGPESRDGVSKELRQVADGFLAMPEAGIRQLLLRNTPEGGAAR